jgi:stress-induced morphogen
LRLSKIGHAARATEPQIRNWREDSRERGLPRADLNLAWENDGAGATDMAMGGTEIERLIREAFPDADVIVTDLAGDGDHFGARVVSRTFAGKSRVQQHQMVYAALKGRMGEELHALALETAVPK